MNSNLSNNVRTKIIHNIQSSSDKHYQYLWKNFAKFIFSRCNFSKFKYSEVLEFFNFLIEKNQSHSSLLIYRSAISRPLKFYFPEINLTQEDDLTQLLKYCKTHHKKKVQEFPPWDLDKVILMLRDPPEEYNSSLFEMQKAFFLVLLAAPKRIAEFQSLTISKSTVGEDFIILRPHQKFIKKNHSSNFVPRDLKIPCFKECSSICPVKNLKNYLRISDNLCKENNVHRPDNLWIDSKGKPLSLLKMRSWFRSIIFKSDPSCSIKETIFHSVRGQVASSLDCRGIPLNIIISQMQWKSSSTFQKYYSKLNVKSHCPAILASLSV